MLDGRCKTCIDMSIIQLPIQNQEVRIVVNDRSNHFCLRPRCLLIELLSNSIKLIFVASLHFIDIILKICMIEMRQISSHCIGNLDLLQINHIHGLEYHGSMVLLLLEQSCAVFLVSLRAIDVV